MGRRTTDNSLARKTRIAAKLSIFFVINIFLKMLLPSQFRVASLEGTGRFFSQEKLSKAFEGEATRRLFNGIKAQIFLCSPKKRELFLIKFSSFGDFSGLIHAFALVMGFGGFPLDCDRSNKRDSTSTVIKATKRLNEPLMKYKQG